MPSVMAEIALAVNDKALVAAAGEGKLHGDHASSLFFAELWCRQVEEALEPVMATLAANPWLFADTPTGRRAGTVAMNPLMNRAYVAWVKRVVRLRRRDLILDPRKVKERSFYARLGPTVEGKPGSPSSSNVARVLSTTVREMIREAENKRHLIQMFDSSKPGELFVLDPRLQ